jgi:hypothetical protein
MVKTKDAIRQKMLNLSLKVFKEEEKQQKISPQKKTCFSSSQLDLPAELPTIEHGLKILGVNSCCLSLKKCAASDW